MEIIMIDDKMYDNIYCMWIIRLMIRFIECENCCDQWLDWWSHLLYVEIIMINDKIDDYIYCMCMIRLMIRLMITFIVCVW